MKEEIIIAGFGGQGIMLMGKVLAHAGMKEGFQVSWMPSYGPEMRGGTANCTVIISEKKIASPLSSNPDTIIVMNSPSLEKFQSYVKENGSVYLNSSLISQELEREDIKTVIKAPANKLANEIGNDKVANMVILGSYIAKKGLISTDSVKKSLQELLGNKKDEIIKLNEKALDIGRVS